MPYLVAHQPIAFGTYVSPRRMPPPAPRRGVCFAGTYQLGDLGQQTQSDWASFIFNFISSSQYGAALGQVGIASASQMSPSAVNQIWLRIANIKLSGIQGALRDAFLQRLQAYNASFAAAPAAQPTAPPAPVATPIVTTTPAAINDPSVAGTPVPPGFPHNNVYVDSSGNQWMYNATTGLWQNATAAATSAATTAEQAQAAQIAAATATSPQGAPTPILVSSPTVSPSLPLPSSSYGAPAPVSVSVSSPTPSTYGDILNFLTESTLISPLPNWVVGAGVVLLVMKFGGKGHLL